MSTTEKNVFGRKFKFNFNAKSSNLLYHIRSYVLCFMKH